MPNWAITSILMTGPREAREAFMRDPEGPGAVHSAGSGSAFDPDSMWEGHDDGWWTNVWSAWQQDTEWIDLMGRRHSVGMRMLFFWEDPDNSHIANLRIYEGGDLIRSEHVNADEHRDEYPTPRAWAEAMYALVSDDWGVDHWEPFEITEPAFGELHRTDFPDVPWDHVDAWREEHRVAAEAESAARQEVYERETAELLALARAERATHPDPENPATPPTRPGTLPPALPCAERGVFVCEVDAWSLMWAYAFGYAADSGPGSEVRPPWVGAGDEGWRAGIDAARDAIQAEGMTPAFAADAHGRIRPADAETDEWFIRQLASLAVGLPDADDGPARAPCDTPEDALRTMLLTSDDLTVTLGDADGKGDDDLITVARRWTTEGFLTWTDDIGAPRRGKHHFALIPRGYARLLEGFCRARSDRPDKSQRGDLRGVGTDPQWSARAAVLADERELPPESRIDWTSLFPPGQAQRVALLAHYSGIELDWSATLEDGARTWQEEKDYAGMLGVDADVASAYIATLVGWNVLMPGMGDEWKVRAGSGWGTDVLNALVAGWAGPTAIVVRGEAEDEALSGLFYFDDEWLDVMLGHDGDAREIADAAMARWARDGLLEPFGPDDPSRWVLSAAAYYPSFAQAHPSLIAN